MSHDFLSKWKEEGRQYKEYEELVLWCDYKNNTTFLYHLPEVVSFCLLECTPCVKVDEQGNLKPPVSFSLAEALSERLPHSQWGGIVYSSVFSPWQSQNWI